MTSPPPLPEDPGVRERLLRAAVELFTVRGYAATSVREIVEAAQVTKPVLYYHFGSKEGIDLAVLEEMRGTLRALLERLLAEQGSARHRIERLFLGIYDVFEQQAPVVRFLNAILWGPPQGAPPFDVETFHRPLHDAVQAIVAAGIAAGELRPAEAEDVAIALIALLVFAMDLQLCHPDWGLGRSGLARLLDLAFTGVALPAPAAQESSR